MPRCPAFDAAKAPTLLAFIRQGGYPHVAAEAAGVARQDFDAWVEQGEGRRAREPYLGFALAVRQATAQARLLIEVALGKKDPKFWLSHGPGKETPDCPGWTSEVRPMAKSNEVVDQTGQFQALCAWLVKILAPYPEARQALAQALLARKRNSKRNGERRSFPSLDDLLQPPKSGQRHEFPESEN